MSDLTATNCGCSNCNGTSTANGLFGGNCIWLILLLLFCGNNNGTSLLSGNGCGNGNDCCEWIIWLLILSSICGCNGYNTANNGNGYGCGCGC